jgi:rhomboid protease GluP
MNEQAIMYIQQNNVGYAEQILQQSLNVDPNSSRTLFLLGAISEAKKDLSSAEAHFQKAVQLFPDYVDANFGLARIRYGQGKYLEAIDKLNTCLRIKPDYKPAQDLLALVKNKI